MASEARACNDIHFCIAFLGHSHLDPSLNAVRKPLLAHIMRPQVGALMDSLAEVLADSQHQPPVSEDASTMIPASRL